MERLVAAIVISLMFFSSPFAAEEKVNLKTIKDKKMIKCLADYIKNNRTHVMMVINEKGEKELHIPRKYVEECKKKLSH